MSQTINALSDNIGRIFRYILPGILILGGALAAYPSLFRWVDLQSTPHLLLLAVVAVVAGNTWFVFHRYGIHQLVDLVGYILARKGPSPDRVSIKAAANYVDDLAKHVVKALREVPNDAIRQHIALRASSMHLMYIASEVSLLFSFLNEPGSFFAENALTLRLIGFIGLFLTLWQNVITRRIDWYSVDLYTVGKKPKEQGDDSA